MRSICLGSYWILDEDGFACLFCKFSAPLLLGRSGDKDINGMLDAGRTGERECSRNVDRVDLAYSSTKSLFLSSDFDRSKLLYKGFSNFLSSLFNIFLKISLFKSVKLNFLV